MQPQSKQNVTDPNDLTASKAFLGREFLTWLWFSIEETGGEMQLQVAGNKDENLEIWIDNKITLESATSHVHSQTLKGGQPSASLEATAALINGKMVTEMSLGINYRELEASFRLSCKDLCPKAIGFNYKRPGSDQVTGDEINEKIEALQTVLDIVDDLFGQFISARTDDSWDKKDLDRMRDWVESRSQENLH